MKTCRFCWRTAKWRFVFEGVELRVCDKHMDAAEAESRQVKRQPVLTKRQAARMQLETQELKVVST